MTDEQVDKKWQGAAERLRAHLAKSVGVDGYIDPLSITADQIDDLLCYNHNLLFPDPRFRIERGEVDEGTMFEYVPGKLREVP